MVTATRKAKQEADLKHVVENILEIDFIDTYLTSISINKIGTFVMASVTVLEKATRPSPVAGEPDIKILDHDVDAIIAFQHYVKYMNSQPDVSKQIQQDYANDS
jgi:accessory colonization factor AcfC